MTTTYGELRTNAEKITDEILRERVQRGIELLEREVGPDWVDRVDPAILDLGSPTECVLGQVFWDAEPTDEQWVAADAAGFIQDGDGFTKGVAILDGELLRMQGQIEYGFNATTGGYGALTRAWLVALGVDEADA